METRSNWTKRWVDQSGEQWRAWNLKTDRRNEFVRKMKHFCPSLTPWKIIINWTRRNEAYWQAIDSCTRKIRNFPRIADICSAESSIGITWNCDQGYIETWIVCFVLLLIGDGGRDFFFNWVQPGSRDGPRSVCSIVDLRVEVHLPLASALCDYRSMTKFYPQYRSSADRRIDFNRVDLLLSTFLPLYL